MSKDAVRKGTKFKRIALFVVIVILLGFVAAAIWGVATNRVVVSLDPNHVLIVQNVVCDSSTVEEFNSLFEFGVAEGSEQTLASLAEDINNRNDWQSDPTCHYIRQEQLTREGEYDEAQRSVDAIKELASDNKYPHSGLLGLSSYYDLDRHIEALRSAPTGQSEAMEGV